MQAENGVQCPLNKGVVKGIVSGNCLAALNISPDTHQAIMGSFEPVM